MKTTIKKQLSGSDTEAMIKDILTNSKKDIQAALKEKVKESIVNNLSWKLESELDGIVKDFVEKKMSKDIAKTLNKMKPQILAELETGLVKVGAEVAKAVYAKALENLGDSWKSGKIIKELFD